MFTIPTNHFSSPDGGATGEVNHSFTSGIQANASVFTYSATPIGTASAGRKVIVCTYQVRDVGVTTSSVTVGGVSATKVAEVISTSRSSSFWIASVPTGTTADIVVTNSILGAACIDVFWSPNMNSTTPTATANDLVDASGFLTATLTPPSGGFVIGNVGAFTSGTWTFAGSGSPVETSDAVHGSSGQYSHGSFKVENTTASSFDYTAQCSDTSITFETLFVAAFK